MGKRVARGHQNGVIQRRLETHHPSFTSCLQEAASTEAQLRVRVETLDSELSRAVRERHLATDREETLRQRLAEREEAWRLQASVVIELSGQRGAGGHRIDREVRPTALWGV